MYVYTPRSFDKGARLKVPETVPYRMTQTLQAALGFSGVEGGFRIASEKALRVLRRNKEALLTLLEAFVYDPLVDWTAGADADATKGVEVHVCLSLFASRVDEMKVGLATNLESGGKALGALQRAANDFVNAALTEAAGLQDAAQALALERQVLQEVTRQEWAAQQAATPRPGGTAAAPAETMGQLEAQLAAAQAAVGEALVQATSKTVQQEAALAALRGGRAAALRDAWASLLPALPGAGAAGRPGEVAGAFRTVVEGGVAVAEALGWYAEALAALPSDYWCTGRAGQVRQGLGAALQDPSAARRLGHMLTAEEDEAEAEAQRAELMGVQRRRDGELAAARAKEGDLQTVRLAALDPCGPQLLEEAVSVSHGAWARHADRPALGQAACALQLCDTLAGVLSVALPESPGMNEVYICVGAT